MSTISREFEKRDKKVHKMTRDGLVEKNLATGEEVRLSRRGQDFDLRKEKPGHSSTDSVRQAISDSRSHRQRQYAPEMPANSVREDGSRQGDTPTRPYEAGQHTPEQPEGADASMEPRRQSIELPARPMCEGSSSGSRSRQEHDIGHDMRNRAAYRYNEEERRRAEEAASGAEQPVDSQPIDFPAPEDHPAETDQPEIREGHPSPSQNRSGTRRKNPLSERAGRLRFDDTHGEFSGSKPRQHGTKYQRRFTEDGDAAKTDAAPDAGKTAEAIPPPKPEKLRFSGEETPPGAAVPGKKLKKAQAKAEYSAMKLEAAKQRLPKKHSMKVERNFDPESGKPKRRLRFEDEVKTQREHLKGPLPLRPVKAGANAAAHYAHRKIRQVEQENVGVEAAHKGEILAEGAMRRAYRFHRLKPYRRVARLEQKTAKRAADLAWQKTLHDNPKLQSNLLSRMAQKRKIQKQYAQRARNARRTAERTKKAGTAAARATRAVTGFIRRHPVVVGAVALVLVVIFFFSSLFTSCTNMAGGGFGSVIMSSYTAADEDILAVEEDYLALEAELRENIDNIESDYPGFDEYRYSLAEIGHDPYKLASHLTALYYDYTPEEVQAELQQVFDQQYTLTITEVVEVRYRTETRTGHYTDSEGNRHSYTYTVEVAYNYYILDVTLTNSAVSGVAASNLDAGQYEMYGIYMETLGNKPYLFEEYLNAGTSGTSGTSGYLDYEVSGEALSDADFAALIAEAEKYLGYPYVWGGSSPSTSFDCSGFVCYVLNSSGVASVGRTTANGLYSMCTIVSASEAKPGDLIFFQGTYDTSGASHVGIYVGDGMMIHCGSPISYANINSSYWQSHFLVFGRIY